MKIPRPSPEQLAANLAAMHAKTAALRASAGELKQDWLDAEVWAEMARARGIRLPAAFVRPEPHLIRRYLRKLDIKPREFLEWGAYSKLEDFARLNPRWPLRALVGVLLEYAAERDEARETLGAKLSEDRKSD